MRAVIADFPRHWLEERKRSGAHRYDEFWDGVLHVPPPRNGNHSELVLDLTGFLNQNWAKPRGGDVLYGVNVTTPADAVDWLHNFRIADLVLLDQDRLAFDRNECVVGPPLVAVMLRAPRDETYEKFPFYAKLGVPEVWVFDRDTRVPELYALGPEPAYQPVPADADGWLVSPAAGVAFRHAGGAKVSVRVGTGAAAELPDA